MTTLSPPQPPDLDHRVRRLREPLLAELRPIRTVRPVRRRTARSVPAIAAATLAVVIAVTALVATRGPARALAVEREDGWIELRVADASASAEALTRELRAAGIPGEVRLLPVAANDVGSWAIISEHADAPGERRLPPATGAGAATGAGPEETVRLSRIENDGETLRIPVAQARESSGYFVFYAGREARPGEELMRDGRLNYAP